MYTQPQQICGYTAKPELSAIVNMKEPFARQSSSIHRRGAHFAPPAGCSATKCSLSAKLGTPADWLGLEPPRRHGYNRAIQFRENKLLRSLFETGKGVEILSPEILN